MYNKAKFKELVRGQSPHYWIKEQMGRSTVADNHPHCKVGYVMAKLTKEHPIILVENDELYLENIRDVLKEDFDLTETQIDRLFDLNDTSPTGDVAEARIIQYVNHLKNTIDYADSKFGERKLKKIEIKGEGLLCSCGNSNLDRMSLEYTNSDYWRGISGVVGGEIKIGTVIWEHPENKVQIYCLECSTPYDVPPGMKVEELW